MRKAETERAEADLTLAQHTYDRKRTLVATHDAPVADLDRATATLAVAERGLEQARFTYKEAVSGYTREDLGIAQSKVEAAQAGVDTPFSLWSIRWSLWRPPTARCSASRSRTGSMFCPASR